MLKKPVHIHWCYILSDQRSATLTVILLTFQLICWSAQRGLVDYPVNTFCMARDFSGSLMISVGGTTGVVCRKNSSLSSPPPPPANQPLQGISPIIFLPKPLIVSPHVSIAQPSKAHTKLPATQPGSHKTTCKFSLALSYSWSTFW